MYSWLPIAAAGAASLGLCLAAADEGVKKAAGASIYDFAVADIDGKEVKLSKYKGDVLMIVNVASRWGLTDKTYSGLESIYKKYKDQGFHVLAFPANNFGSQEPGSNAEIKAFCRSEKQATFELFAKISVQGDDQAPLFRHLTKHPNEAIAGDVAWNFQKYLVARDGRVVAKWSPRTLPTDETVTKRIEKALSGKAKQTGS